jgi:hypothetical protein
VPTFQERNKLWVSHPVASNAPESVTASTESATTVTPGGVSFGGSASAEALEKQTQLEAARQAEAKKHEEEIVKAMESNMSKWGTALTDTIKEIMKGGETK